MGYIKCPRCDLNYMLDGEELCDVCKIEIGYKEHKVKIRDGSIYGYVCKVFDDFKDYLNESNVLCDLRSISFEGSRLPDYANVHVQQLYVLRYSYAYAYEYKLIYKELFKSYTLGTDITVTSIGCGNLIDYWSLCEVLRENGNDDTNIKYIGLDIIDWQYKIQNIEDRTTDDVCFKQTDVIKYFEDIDRLDSDVYLFPKSISEYTNYDFIRLCDCFKNKPISKDKFCLLVSIRPVDIWGRKDVDRVASLINAIVANGFLTTDNPDTIYIDDHPDGGIFYLDPQFNYPLYIIDTLKSLTNRCDTENNKQFDCTKCDKINRSPILTAKYVQYQIFTFYRENKE